MLSDFKRLFLRELATLERQLELYPDEASIWKNVPGLPNSAGNLILHLCGNLQHFIGATLGNTGYLRNREAEFSSRDLPRQHLQQELKTTREALETSFEKLSAETLDALYELPIQQVQLSTRLTLMHLSSHLAYHLGQIDYHRRIVTGQNTSANAVSFSEL